MLSNTLRLNFCYLKIIHILHPHYYLKITHVFFISNQVAKGLTLKNDLKVKQLAKQPATLKTLLQKILVELWVKKMTFSILSLLKLNISSIAFGTS